MNKVDLRGRYVLQIDEVVNFTASAKERYTPAGNPPPSSSSHRMLKLLMTDGVQTVEGFEYRGGIPGLGWDMEAGCKILVQGTIPMRKGHMVLQAHNVTFLGGMVRQCTPYEGKD